MEANKTTPEIMTAIDILNDRGFKANSDLPYCAKDGTEYFVGYSRDKRAAIVALIQSEDKYLLTKETLREMAVSAGTYGIKEITMYTNYGCEICTSQGERPKTVRLHNIIKINVDGFNAGENPTPPAPVKETEAVVNELVMALEDLINEWKRQKGLFPELSKDGWMELKINNATTLLNNLKN